MFGGRDLTEDDPFDEAHSSQHLRARVAYAVNARSIRLFTGVRRGIRSDDAYFREEEEQGQAACWLRRQCCTMGCSC